MQKIQKQMQFAFVKNKNKNKLLVYTELERKNISLYDTMTYGFRENILLLEIVFSFDHRENQIFLIIP